MCGSRADIQSTTTEIRRGKKEKRRRKETTGKNIMVCPIPQGNHKKDAAGSLQICEQNYMLTGLQSLHNVTTKCISAIINSIATG